MSTVDCFSTEDIDTSTIPMQKSGEMSLQSYPALRSIAAAAIAVTLLAISDTGQYFATAALPVRAAGPSASALRSNTSQDLSLLQATSRRHGIAAWRSKGGLSSLTNSRIATTCSGPPVHDWLHTSGVWIEDQNSCKVRLVSVDWYGMDTTNYVPAGLNFQSYKTILGEVKQLGFNSIRFSISEQMVRYNSKLHVNNRYIKKDPELKGLHPLQVLDRIAAAASRLGLFLILDDHSAVAAKPATAHIEALWDQFTEKGWIHDWETLAKRYKKNPTVIGFDLKNEPHTNGPGPWSLKTYLKQGATWGKYSSKLWRSGTDWARAATAAGNALLSVNPHLLVFVEGVQLYPNPSKARGVETYWWGGILKGVKVEPVVLNVPHQLVYSPHEWGPGRTRLSQFNSKTSFFSLSKIFYANWAFILNSKRARIQAPIWLGEFNTYNDAKKWVVSKVHGSQGQWFQIMVRYLKRNPEIGWSYFGINGTNAADQYATTGILDRKWHGVKLPLLMKTLKPIMSQP